MVQLRRLRFWRIGWGVTGLTNATPPYALAIADKGFEKAILDAALYKGVNTYKGKLTYNSVAEAFGMKFTELKKIL